MTEAIDIEQLKRQAKRIVKKEGVKHAVALDRMAVHYGFKNWALLMRTTTIKNGIK